MKDWDNDMHEQALERREIKRLDTLKAKTIQLSAKQENKETSSNATKCEAEK